MIDLKNRGLKSRGLRNNNPGNIRISSAKWKGKIPNNRNTDRVFEQFEFAEYGVRAFFILSRTYSKKYGISTVKAFISRYAPASENNTNAYVQAVCKSLGVAPTQKVDFTNELFVKRFAKAVFRVENKASEYDYITDELIHNGYALAFSNGTAKEYLSGVETPAQEKASNVLTLVLLTILTILIFKF